IYGIEERNGQPVIVMELLEGQSLKQRIRARPVSTDELLDFGIQASDGLHAAHAKGIIHRDIKPANIFIVGNGRLKILDFGVAKVIPPEAKDQSGEESLTLKGAVLGTTSYMSPEQVRGEEIDARSDLFSLGVALYEVATGQQPFARENAVLTIDAILNVRPATPSSVNPALPSGLSTIIAGMLEKDRELRYQDAADISSDLKLLKEGKQPRESITATTIVPVRAQPRRYWRRAVAASFGAFSIAGAAFLYFHRAPALSEKDTIVLADFVNATGDPVFDGTLRQGLAVQLQQSPFLSLISDQRIQRMLRLMGQPVDARLTPDVARQICERTASSAVLEGSIASLGTQYVLGLRAKNCRSGDLIDEEQIQAGRKEDVLNALSQLASKFRTRVGESLATIANHDTPLAEATTPSLEALEAYSAGWKIHAARGAIASLPFFRRAIEIDPGFAMAHASLGRIYADLDESDLAAQSTRRAWEMRDRASDPEKFFILASYSALVTGNLDEARQICEAWARAYPREARPHHLLSGVLNKVAGQYETAIVEARKAIELDPDFAIGYYNLAVNHVYLDRLEEAEDALRRAAARGLEIDEFLMLEYDIAFLKSDQAGMERQAARARGGSGAENWISNKEAFALAYSGHLQQARNTSRRAVDQAQHAAQRERAGLWEAGAAVREAFFGNASEARKRATAALQLSRDREVEYGAAFALAIAGEPSGSQALANDLERRFPEDTSVRFAYLPVLRARLALNHGDVSKAFELLQAAVPYELGVARVSFGALYPIYVRGGLSSRAPGCRGCHRIPEDSRSPRDCSNRSCRRAGALATGAGPGFIGR
ncbi:MAG: protein kinase, partial [Bryobacteraceae bacterium]